MFHYGINPRKNRSVSSTGLVPKKTQQVPTTLNFNNAYEYNRIHSKNNQRLPPVLGALSSPIDEAAIASTFDEIMINSNSLPLNSAVEGPLIRLFHAHQIYFWIYNKTNDQLYSLTLTLSIPKDQGIIGSSFCSQKVIMAQNPSINPHFNSDVDTCTSYGRNASGSISDNNTLSELIIPLHHFDNTQFGAIQIFRQESFNDNELLICNLIIKKFSIYSNSLFSTYTLSFPSESHYGNSISSLLSKIQGILHSRSTELWKFDKNPLLFDVKSNSFVQIEDAGVVKKAFQLNVPISILNVLNDSFYCENIDGKAPESIIIEPFSQNYAICVRGPAHCGISEQQKIHSLAPLFEFCLNSDGPQNENISSEQIIDQDQILSSNSTDLAERLKALLEVAESLSGVLDIDALIPTIMEKSCDLLKTERCSLFLISDNQKELVTRFHGGLDKNIRMPIDKGIVGYTCTTGNVVNITDAYADPRFDQHIDKETGFKTRNILTVPIYNNRGDIAGVTEMINKIGSEPFDEEDIKMMMAFNVFCGISLDNAKLYQASLDLTRQLRGFVEMSSALNKTKTVHDVISEILSNAQAVIHASRGSVFVLDDNSLGLYVNIGESSTYGTIFADDCVKTRETRIFGPEEIALLIDSSPTSSINKKLCKVGKTPRQDSSRLSSVLESDPNVSQKVHEEKQPSIAVFPLLMNDSQLLGVMEMESNSKILPEDLKLLDCFAVFAAVSIERSELQEVAKVGYLESQMKKYLTQNEREGFNIPEKLKISVEKDGEKALTIPHINFDAVAWDGFGHFKVIFTIFNMYNLLSEFDVNNEMFFKFLSEISSTYNKVPYHNWRHAVDVTEFVTYELQISKMDEILSKFELFGLLISSICHDANHDGFTNVFNEKAETPLGILFKNQSVMETHHCSVTIGVISKTETNLFHKLDPNEYKSMWNLIIQLILITDMAKHFNFLEEVNALCDKNQFTFESASERLYGMQLILKCGDVSNVSRPFELADKWCDVLCEEFFRQGDLEMASGMEYTSPLNDRAHLDKPKSQIGFYNFVCLPLYVTAARVFPPLQVNVDQVRSNLAVWKAAHEENNKTNESG